MGWVDARHGSGCLGGCGEVGGVRAGWIWLEAGISINYKESNFFMPGKD
mgnify:CR=1 FL=1